MTAAPAPPARRLPPAVIAAFASPGVPLAATLLMFGVYLPRFYAALGVDFLVVGLVILAVRLIDIWFDPFIGLAIDRTRTPIGRYRPWLLAGAPLLMLGVYRLLMPPTAPSAGYMVIWLLVAFAGSSMLNLALASWSAVLATNYNERSRLFGWTQALAVLGSIVLLLLPVLTRGAVVPGKTASMPTIAWILILALPLGVAICAIVTPERLAPASDRPRFKLADYWRAISRPSMRRVIAADLLLTLGPGTTGPLYIYFFHDAKGFSVAEASVLLIFYIGAGVIGAPFWGRVARNIGKHRAVQVACVCYGIAQTTLMVLPRVTAGHTPAAALPTMAGMFAVGFCASAFLLLIRAMVADVVDEVRLEGGQDVTGLLFAMVTTTFKIGGAVTVAIVFPILKLVGYNGKEGAVNTAHAIFGLEMCYLFAPIILVFAGGAMFFGYKLDSKRHGEIRAALEERDAALSVAAAEEALVGKAG